MAPIFTTGFGFLPPNPPGSAVTPPPPGPALKRTRYGVAVINTPSSTGEGPTWTEVKGSLSTNAGLGGKVKARRIYATPGQPFTTLQGDILDAATVGAVAVASVKLNTQVQFNQLHNDMAAFSAAHPGLTWVLACNHEPRTEYTPSTFIPNQLSFLSATAGIDACVPAIIWNGYFWSGITASRQSMIREGDFPAWAPSNLLQALNAQQGIAMMDAYPGARQAMPGNNPPTQATSGENAGARIRNFAKWCAGKPFATNSGPVPGAPTVMPRLGCGEIGDWDLAMMRDTMAAIRECLDLAVFWDHRSFASALENTSPPLNNGNGGNPNSAAWKSAYLAEYDRVQALGGPPPIQSM